MTSSFYCLVFEDFLKLYFPFFSFRVDLIHYVNQLFFFSVSKSKVVIIDYILKLFLISRSYLTSKLLVFPGSLYTGFNLSGWSFFISRSSKFLGTISLDNLRNYKCRLKLVVKSPLLVQPFFKLKKLNSLISDWCLFYGSADIDYDLWGCLDIYLYKLLWSWVKRRHPRRPNTWIYAKYWRFFPSLNIWRFYVLDYSLAKCLFLNVHVGCSTNDYFVPSSMNIFSLKDYNKLGLNWVKKCSQILGGLILFLYKSQSGKCFCCNKFFTNLDSFNIKVFRLRLLSSRVVRYSLLHISCYVYFCLFKNLLF